MVRSRTARAALLAAVAIAAPACDDETPTTPTNPTPTVTETFSGNVTQNGAQTHSFAVAGGGAVTATLKEVAPDSALVIGFSLGNWNPTAGTCQIVLANDAATGGFSFTGTMSGIGNLCVRVYDVGNIPAATPAAYTVEVIHP